jgi:hypothetical protein
MDNKIIAKCKRNEIPAINSEGRWFPCCDFNQTGKIFEQSIFINDEYLISNNKSLKFSEKESFKKWISEIENNYDKAPKVCKHRCSLKSLQVIDNETTNYFLQTEFDIHNFLEEHDIEYEW